MQYGPKPSQRLYQRLYQKALHEALLEALYKAPLKPCTELCRDFAYSSTEAPRRALCGVLAEFRVEL